MLPRLGTRVNVIACLQMCAHKHARLCPSTLIHIGAGDVRHTRSTVMTVAHEHYIEWFCRVCAVGDIRRLYCVFVRTVIVDDLVHFCRELL
jgi:poly-beta-hydroxyalkanoate depolymerase